MPTPVPLGARTRTPDPVAAMARLGDREREVAVLRLLLGHSLAHTARQLDQGTRRQVDAHARQGQGECGRGPAPRHRSGGAPADASRGQRLLKNRWRLATAVSGLSENSPSTPRRKNRRYSAGASPVARR
jgi:hypothetical protein